MSALHTLQISNNRLQSDMNRLKGRVVSERLQLTSETHALRQSLQAQQQQTARVNEMLKRQNERADGIISQLKTSFKATQENLQRQYQTQQQQLNDKLVHQAQKFNETLDLQQEQFTQSLQSYNDDLNQKVEEETKQRQDMISELRNYTNTHLSQMRAEYTDIIQNQQNQITQVKNEVHRLFEREHKSKELAVDSLSDLQLYIDGLLNDKGRLLRQDYERFKPGRLDTIVSRLNSINQMIALENFQAAIAQIEAAHNGLIDLEFEVMQEKNKFDNEYAWTILAYEYLMQSAKQNEIIPLKGEAKLKLNEWSEGKYETYLAKLQTIQSEIQNGYAQLTLKDLESLQKQQEALNEELRAIINEGIERVISAQQRKDMAIKIAEVLQGYNFEPEIAGYDREDQKESYIVGTVRAADHTKVTVTIIPNEKTFENTIAINTDQPGFLRTPDADQRTEAIINVMQKANIKVRNKHSLPEHEEAMMNCYDNIRGDGIPKAVLEKVKDISNRFR